MLSCKIFVDLIWTVVRSFASGAVGPGCKYQLEHEVCPLTRKSNATMPQARIYNVVSGIW